MAQKITPHLWFDKEAEEAAKFYTSVFSNGKINATTHYPEAGQEIHHQEEGAVMTVAFEIEGYNFLALNAGPLFKINPSISFFVNFDPSKDPEAKEHLNELWGKLSEGGMAPMPLDKYPFSEWYGWIQDKFGVSWQLILTNPSGEERPKIVPSLLFTQDVAGKAEEAINFYVSVFKNSKIGTVARYPAGMEPDKEGTLMFSDFMLENQWFTAMDSAQDHKFKFNEAISLLVTVKDQEELDQIWNQMSAVPESEQCGWLKDKFRVSWQIVPSGMEEVLNNPDKEKANCAMEAMLKMKKINIEALRKASE